MRYVLLLSVTLVLFSCSDAFLKHSLKSDKAGDCIQTNTPVKITANTNGERYEFMACADEGFDGKAYAVTRNGDSLTVNLPTSGSKQSLYKMTLDIDAKPAYHYITIDGKTLIVSVTRF